MKTYNKKQVKQIIKYAMEYQRGYDYQLIGRILLVNGYNITKNDFELLDLFVKHKTAHDEIDIDKTLTNNQ